jgi:predicted dehydrogenase
VIGLGIRGGMMDLVFNNAPGAAVTALCDVYAARVDQAQQKIKGARGFSDYRKLIELKDLDAVYVATPDHWHVPMAIEALNAGKDVYVEKPLTLHIEEGPEIVKAARVNNRICQVGTQRRSSMLFQEVKREFIDSGRLGKLVMFRSWYHHNLVHDRKAPPELKTQPGNLDWARFLGPVKWRDYNPEQFYNFRGYLEFGGGMVTDLFTHLIDVAHWFTGEDIPCSAVATGGIYHIKSDRTAPDTIQTTLEYPSGWTATFAAAIYGARVSLNGMEFLGTKGRLTQTGDEIEFATEMGKPPEQRTFARDRAHVAHVENFLECMRTRKRPNCDVMDGHRSAQASHLCNIAYKEQRLIRFDPRREEIIS